MSHCAYNGGTPAGEPPKANCFICGASFDRERASVSHTICPGVLLCTDCGHRETVDPAWASGVRLGLLRAEAGRRAMKIAEETGGEG